MDVVQHLSFRIRIDVSHGQHEHDANSYHCAKRNQAPASRGISRPFVDVLHFVIGYQQLADARQAMELYQQAARAHVERTLTGGSEAVQAYLASGMALYNTGDALSGEALTAYCRERSQDLRFVKLSLRADRLEPAFH